MKRNLKILIVGSCDHTELVGAALEDYRRKYRSICEELARAIVAHGHTIVIGSVRDNTADKYALDKVTGAGKPAEVLLISDAIHWQKIPQLPTGHRTKLHWEETWSWPAGRVTQAALCNAVIAIGGKENTLSSAYMGLALGKVIIGIPSAGHSGAEITKQLMPFYNKANVGQLMNEITHSWNATDADRVVDALERLEKLGVFRIRHPYRLTLIAFVFMILAIVGSLSFPQSYMNPIFFNYWHFTSTVIIISLIANIVWLHDRFENFGWLSDSLFRTIAASLAIWVIWMAGAELALVHLTAPTMYRLALAVVVLSFFWEQVAGRFSSLLMKLLRFVITQAHGGLGLGNS